MVEESTINPSKIWKETSSSNESNGLENNKDQLCENLEVAGVPSDGGETNNQTPESNAQEMSMSTLTETPDINNNISNPSPSRMDVNGITFQLNNSGKAICIPEPIARRKLLNIDPIITDAADAEDGYDSEGDLGPF